MQQNRSSHNSSRSNNKTTTAAKAERAAEQQQKLQKTSVNISPTLKGLVTAKLLKDVGYRVTILEGSDRLGGRIQTHRDQRDGWMAEMGPMRYPESQVYTRTLANHFGLRMEPFVTEKSIRAVFMRNQRWSDSLIRQGKEGKGFAGSQQSCLMIPRLESPSIRNTTYYRCVSNC